MIYKHMNIMLHCIQGISIRNTYYYCLLSFVILKCILNIYAYKFILL